MSEGFFPPTYMCCVFHTPDLKSFSKKKKEIQLEQIMSYYRYLVVVFSEFSVAVRVRKTYYFSSNIRIMYYIPLISYTG